MRSLSRPDPAGPAIEHRQTLAQISAALDTLDSRSISAMTSIVVRRVYDNLKVAELNDDADPLGTSYREQLHHFLDGKHRPSSQTPHQYDLDGETTKTFLASNEILSIIHQNRNRSYPDSPQFIMLHHHRSGKSASIQLNQDHTCSQNFLVTSKIERNRDRDTAGQLLFELVEHVLLPILSAHDAMALMGSLGEFVSESTTTNELLSMRLGHHHLPKPITLEAEPIHGANLIAEFLRLNRPELYLSDIEIQLRGPESQKESHIRFYDGYYRRNTAYRFYGLPDLKLPKGRKKNTQRASRPPHLIDAHPAEVIAWASRHPGLASQAMLCPDQIKFGGIIYARSAALSENVSLYGPDQWLGEHFRTGISHVIVHDKTPVAWMEDKTKKFHALGDRGTLIQHSYNWTKGYPPPDAAIAYLTQQLEISPAEKSDLATALSSEKLSIRMSKRMKPLAARSRKTSQADPGQQP